MIGRAAVADDCGAINLNLFRKIETENTESLGADGENNSLSSHEATIT